MSRRRTIAAVVLALVALGLVAPVARAASDLYANLGPGGQSSPAVDRYPLGNYVLDAHFSAVKASLTGGVDASGVPSMIAFFLANTVWLITAFLANTVISLFALAFSIDLLNGSPNTAGAGALAPVADASIADGHVGAVDRHLVELVGAAGVFGELEVRRVGRHPGHLSRGTRWRRR